MHIFNSHPSDRLQLVISIKWFSGRVNAYFHCLDVGTGLLGINPRVTQSHLEAMRFIWMSCEARGCLHFTSLILENLNHRAAFLCTPGVWKGSYPPRTDSKSQAKPREGRMGVSPYTLSTPCSAANNRHLLNTNCVLFTGHKRATTLRPVSTGFTGHYSSLFSHMCPRYEAMLAWYNCSDQIYHC